MGVNVTEELVLGSGVSVNSYYVSINTNEIRIRKDVRENREHVYDAETDTHTDSVTTTTKYTAEGGFTMWISKEAKESGKSSIGHKYVSIEQDTPITGNIYDVLYAELKTQLPNSTDV